MSVYATIEAIHTVCNVMAGCVLFLLLCVVLLASYKEMFPANESIGCGNVGKVSYPATAIIYAIVVAAYYFQLDYLQLIVGVYGAQYGVANELIRLHCFIFLATLLLIVARGFYVISEIDRGFYNQERRLVEIISESSRISKFETLLRVSMLVLLYIFSGTSLIVGDQNGSAVLSEYLATCQSYVQNLGNFDKTKLFDNCFKVEISHLPARGQGSAQTISSSLVQKMWPLYLIYTMMFAWSFSIFLYVRLRFAGEQKLVSQLKLQSIVPITSVLSLLTMQAWTGVAADELLFGLNIFPTNVENAKTLELITLSIVGIFVGMISLLFLSYRALTDLVLMISNIRKNSTIDAYPNRIANN